MADRLPVVVIGGGVAGLVAASSLAAAGRRVELVERHRRAGGLCSGFRRRGYTFDAAAHAIGGCHPGGPLRRLLERIGAWERLEMVAADPVDTVACPAWRIRVWRDTSRFTDELAAAFPASADRLRRFVAWLEAFGPDGTAAVEGTTFAEVLDGFGIDGEARAVFLAPLGNVGAPSDRLAAAAGCALWRDNQLAGGWAPRGGFQRLADALAGRAAELGVAVSTGVEAARIELADGRVRAVEVRERQGGIRRIPCHAVVAAAPAPHVLLDLVGRDRLPVALRSRVEGGEPSFAGAVLSLGIGDDLHAAARGSVRTWWIETPDPSAVDAAFRADMADHEVYAGEGSCLVSVPTLLDPALAPAGATVVSVIVPAGGRVVPDRDRLRRAALARARKVLPIDPATLEVSELATPETVERYTRNLHGAWYGWAPTPGQSGANRLAPTTPIAGLVLAGHWTRPGPGVVNAAVSGAIAARLVLRTRP